MKVKKMPADQYKLSIEALPLQVLYSKYNAGDVNSSLQVVRPLGRVRKERRPSSECPNQKKSPKVRPDEHGQRTNRRTCVSEIKMPKQFDTDKSKLRRSDHNLSALEHRDKDSPLPTLSRTKTQEFEHRFRIAASRGQGQESPTLRPSKEYNKKVVHLPLFRINLKTFTGETETSKTVASTRESLKQLMELHKSKMKTTNVTTANIKNYEFLGPHLTNNSVSKNDGAANGVVVSPFPAKPALKNSKVREAHRIAVNKKKQFRFDLSENQLNGETDSRSSHSERDDSPERGVSRQRMDEIGPEDEPDDSMLSVAIRPDTSLTLGSTMHQIDRVIKSPGSDELRELSEVFKNADSQPAWPSYDDVQRMRAYAQSRNQSRSRRSRPSTVLKDVLETPMEGYRTPRSRSTHYCDGYTTEQWPGPKPVLRYTSKPSQYKLDPIIVPSHTCTECPMCNIYQREVETPCPPNTPMSSQFMESQYVLGSRELTTKPYTTGTRDARMHGKQEVLHLSRINVAGSNTPSEDQRVLSYMKANG